MNIEKEILIQQLGNPNTPRALDRLYQFAFIPHSKIESIATTALTEEWGKDRWALTKYLAIQIPWSIEQGRFTSGENQLYIAAGHLQTRYGTPLHLVFAPNNDPEKSPWCLVHAGDRVSAPSLPSPPEIPAPAKIPRGAEIVIMHEHILEDNADRVPFLKGAPRVAQMCALAGSIQWSLNRGLELPHWYHGQMSYLVPLYLQTREDITRAPDIIAPVQVSDERLTVRTVLDATAVYPGARVAVRRHDQLPSWLLTAWNEKAPTLELEDPDS